MDEAFLDVTGSVAALAALNLLGSSAAVGSLQASFGFAKSSSVLVFGFWVYKLTPSASQTTVAPRYGQETGWRLHTALSCHFVRDAGVQMLRGCVGAVEFNRYVAYPLRAPCSFQLVPRVPFVKPWFTHQASHCFASGQVLCVFRRGLPKDMLFYCKHPFLRVKASDIPKAGLGMVCQDTELCRETALFRKPSKSPLDRYSGCLALLKWAKRYKTPGHHWQRGPGIAFVFCTMEIMYADDLRCFIKLCWVAPAKSSSNFSNKFKSSLA